MKNYKNKKNGFDLNSLMSNNKGGLYSILGTKMKKIKTFAYIIIFVSVFNFLVSIMFLINFFLNK